MRTRHVEKLVGGYFAWVFRASTSCSRQETLHEARDNYATGVVRTCPSRPFAGPTPRRAPIFSAPPAGLFVLARRALMATGAKPTKRDCQSEAADGYVSKAHAKQHMRRRYCQLFVRLRRFVVARRTLRRPHRRRLQARPLPCLRPGATTWTSKERRGSKRRPTLRSSSPTSKKYRCECTAGSDNVGEGQTDCHTVLPGYYMIDADSGRWLNATGSAWCWGVCVGTQYITCM
jgi:hypothetical protein